MTAPRQVLPGTSYLVTRRCSERRFFLRPSAQVTAIFRYVLAVAAQRHGILVHAFCVLSNHFHLVVTDPDGRLPDFQRCLDSLVARAMNRALERSESFWDPDSYSAVRLETASAVFEKIVYVLANPVAAGLVHRGRDWPGLWSDPDSLGAPPINVTRPGEFFRPIGPLPAEAQLRLTPPPGAGGDAAFVASLQRALHEAEERARAALRAQGRSFLGVAAVLAQKPGAHPARREPWGALNPRVACKIPWKRAEALLRLAEFASAYREALAAWRAGVREVLFPPGTWLMRVQHRVACASPT